MSYQYELLLTIEKLRKELNEIMDKNGIINEEIIEKSKELDKRLNEYYQNYILNKGESL